MGKQLEAIFALVDKASGPGKSISVSLKMVNDSAEKLEKKSSTFGEKFAKGFSEARKGANAVGEAFAWTAGVMLAAAAAAAGFAYMLGKQVVEASETKERFQKILELVDGIGVSSEDTLDSIKEMANATGQSDSALTDMYIGLRRLGFAADDTKDVIAAALDVKALGGQAAGDAFQKIFEKIKTSGDFKFEAREFLGAGITEEQIAKTLQTYDRFKGKSIAQIEAMMKAGKVTADEGMKALLDTVNTDIDKGAGLGSAGKDILGGSFEGQIQKLKNSFGDMLEDIDLTPLIDFVNSLNDLLKGDVGGQLKDMIGGAFRDMGKAIGSIDPAVIKSWGAFLVKAASGAMELAAALGGGLVGTLMTMLGWLKTSIMLGDGNSTMWKNLVTGMKFVGAVFGVVVASLVIGIGVVIAAVAAIGYFFVWLGGIAVDAFNWILAGVDALARGAVWLVGLWDSTIATVSETLLSVGTSIVEGLWNGIKAAWAWMLRQFDELLGLLPTAVKKVLGIASPSKVMMGLGISTMQGFNVGVEQAANDNVIADAVSSQALPTIAASSGGGGNVYNIQIVVNATPDMTPGRAEELGRAAAIGFREQLADELEGVRLAAGAEG